MTRALMFQGTGSNVGKSILVAGLCRAAKRRGIKVAPFKPQNMSNNAAVAHEGGEIGRAQWLQALAAGIPPSIHMNPVLIKPEGDQRAQVILQGKIAGHMAARNFRSRGALLPKVLESFQHLRERTDLILVEGAGSPAEVNLRDGDIANMGFALANNTPVVIIGDIDRGGVIASLVGTHALLTKDEHALIKGFIINKFRGDLALFSGGLAAIKDATAWRGFGVVPWLMAARQLPAEDAVDLETPERGSQAEIKIAVPMLSRIANFDDLDPLKAQKNVEVVIVPPGKALPRDADLIIIPGSKATIADLDFLREQGWDVDIAAHHRQGRRLLGICGGYQMLGRMIHDPDGVEGKAQSRPGLGLLDIETTLTKEKTTRLASGMSLESDVAFEGYEIHMGVSDGQDCARPFLRINDRPHGAVSKDGLVEGGYVHGLFASDAFRRHYLHGLGITNHADFLYRASVEKALDDIAEALEEALDIDQLFACAG